MGQPVVHFELWSKDPARTGEFYSRVFGWKVSHIPELNYWVTDSGEKRGINGGIMAPIEGPWPGNICLYVSVPQLSDAVEKVRAAGGKIIAERVEVPNMGVFALFADTDGRVNGIWEVLTTQKARRRAPPRKKTARRPRARRPRR